MSRFWKVYAITLTALVLACLLFAGVKTGISRFAPGAHDIDAAVRIATKYYRNMENSSGIEKGTKVLLSVENQKDRWIVTFGPEDRASIGGGVEMYVNKQSGEVTNVLGLQ